MEEVKNIALVSHDNRKKDLIEWIEWNYESIIKHKMTCTGTTGVLVEKALKKKRESSENEMQIIKLKSGPLAAINSLDP